MNAIEKYLVPKSGEYASLRAELRVAARNWARERVGQSAANQRARTLLAAAFDAGVSAMVERARGLIAEGYIEQLITLEEYETLQALRTGEYRLIGPYRSAVSSDGSSETRTASLPAATASREGSEGVAPVEPKPSLAPTETLDPDRDLVIEPRERKGGPNIGPVELATEAEQKLGRKWEVGDYCVWTMHPEYGTARIKWIGSRDVVYDGEGPTKRCKLYFETLDRVEEAFLCELHLIGELR